MCLQKVAGMSGILAPLVAFAGIVFSISSYPNFSFTGNWLSDLGVGPTSVGFNSSLVLAGILGSVFCLGFRKTLPTLGKLGCVVLSIGTLALIGVGLFPESSGIYHTITSLVFFGFLIAGMGIVGFSMRKEKVLGSVLLFLFLIALFGVSVIHLKATAEIIAGLTFSGLSIFFGMVLLRNGNQSFKN